MAFVEFERATEGGKVLVNLDNVVEVYLSAGRVRIGYVDDDYVDVVGTWDEVIEKLGRATDIYVEEREEATA